MSKNNLFTAVFEVKTDDQKESYLVLKQDFRQAMDETLAYKGLKFIKSDSGLTLLVKYLYTLDVLSATGDRKMIIVNEDTIDRTSYSATKNQALLVAAGTVYTTESARSRQIKSYKRTNLDYAKSGKVRICTGEKDVVVEDQDGTKRTEKQKIFVTVNLELLLPNQCENFRNQFYRDSVFGQDTAQIEGGAAILTDFSCLATVNGKQLYDYVADAKFGEEVVSLTKIAGPFDDSYDDCRDALSSKECAKWLIM